MALGVVAGRHGGMKNTSNNVQGIKAAREEGSNQTMPQEGITHGNRIEPGRLGRQTAPPVHRRRSQGGMVTEGLQWGGRW